MWITGLCFLVGCQTSSGNVGQLQRYMVPSSEADWIRNGEPIIFEGAQWYPVDDVEILQDTEMYILGKYRGVQFFVEKIDVQPYNRLYTKFGKNKFRFFEKKEP